MNPITQTLASISAGEPQAADKLLPLVYNHLRKVAQDKLARKLPGETIQATALVHEAWVRLTRDDNRAWQGRTHFLAAAAQAMRRILIDRARWQDAIRHGGGQVRLNVDDIDVEAP